MSGLFYWASGCEETGKLITPYSWALSADEMGFTPIATKGDIDCIHWVLEETDPDIIIVSDSNGVFLFEGYTEYISKDYEPIRGEGDRLLWINDIFDLDQCYLFLTDWNTRKGKYTECVDVGLKVNRAFTISNNENGCLTYVADVRESGGIIVVKTVLIKEVYRSGDSVIYEKCYGN